MVMSYVDEEYYVQCMRRCKERKERKEEGKLSRPSLDLPFIAVEEVPR